MMVLHVNMTGHIFFSCIMGTKSFWFYIISMEWRQFSCFFSCIMWHNMLGVRVLWSGLIVWFYIQYGVATLFFVFSCIMERHKWLILHDHLCYFNLVFVMLSRASVY